MFLSTSAQRRYSSSTSGWSAESASTRAMTRRCSVMRMPLDAHRDSILVFDVLTRCLLGVDHNFPGPRGQASAKAHVYLGPDSDFFSSHQVAPKHQGCGSLTIIFLVIAGSPSDLVKPRPTVEPPRRLVVLV